MRSRTQHDLSSQVGRYVVAYRELVAVLAAAAIGLCIERPFAFVTSHHGINLLLVVLVFATALTIELGALRSLGTLWRLLLVVLATSVTVLPALSWLASRVVASGSLRDGIVTIGLAPCEIASIATTALAGGEAALSAGLLIGTTVTTVVFAGPILSLDAVHTSIRPGHIVTNLALIIAAPLVAGLAVGRIHPLTPQAKGRATNAATYAVVALVALIAAEVHFSRLYFGVVIALGLFLASTVVLGNLLSVGSTRSVATAVLMTTSMRDFAIAAGIATTAFGAEAVAPLGLYGIVVLVWGTASAAFLRRRGVVAGAH